MESNEGNHDLHQSTLAIPLLNFKVSAILLFVSYFQCLPREEKVTQNFEIKARSESVR